MFLLPLLVSSIDYTHTCMPVGGGETCFTFPIVCTYQVIFVVYFALSLSFAVLYGVCVCTVPCTVHRAHDTGT